MKSVRKLLSVASCFLLICASCQSLYGQATASDVDTSNPTEGAPSSADPAPIVGGAHRAVSGRAGGPDSYGRRHFLIRLQSLNTGCRQNTSLTGSALMQAVDKQSWDPSVKALTQFPSVLANLAHNLTWTSSLGEAFHNQQAAVMTAVQALRAKAQAAGNLKSTPQVTVVQQSPQVIVIQPANPQVVYVPEYNPAVIYGTPYVTPGYTAGDVVAAALLGSAPELPSER